MLAKMKNAKKLQKPSDRSSVRVFPALGMCLCVAALICGAQILGNTAIILSCLLIYLIVMVWASSRSYAFPILLFFLPWSPLLKIAAGTVSFFTIALLLCVAVSFVQSRFSIHRYQFVLTVLIVLTTLLGKAVHDNAVGNDYLIFGAMLLLFPCVTREQATRMPFYETTIFFACGIVSAALVAGQLANNANISQYITIESYKTVTRSSGFYGDPNFYAAQISACLAGVQLLLCYNKDNKRQLVLMALLILLLYCGLLSASKSFIIVLACLFFCWCLILLRKRRFRLIIGLLCAGGVVLATTAFQSLLQIIATRFTEDTGTSGLTTGRVDIWKSYLQAFLKSPSILAFGEGYSAVNLPVQLFGYTKHRASHNTLIQMVYQFGLLGLPFIVMWIVASIRDLASSLGLKKVYWYHIALMCIGVALPWMGLDILQFDEFFIMPVFAMIGIQYAAAMQDGHVAVG